MESFIKELIHQRQLLDQRYNKYLYSVSSEVNYCTSVTGEDERVDTLENQLLTCVKSIVKEYYLSR